PTMTRYEPSQATRRGCRCAGWRRGSPVSTVPPRRCNWTWPRSSRVPAGMSRSGGARWSGGWCATSTARRGGGPGRTGSRAGRFDVLVTPALATVPPPAISWSTRSWGANMLANVRYAPYAAPWNFAGFPAVVVPVGVRDDGLPVAVQLVGAPGSEFLLLALAG